MHSAQILHLIRPHESALAGRFGRMHFAFSESMARGTTHPDSTIRTRLMRGSSGIEGAIASNVTRDDASSRSFRLQALSRPAAIDKIN
jgi:hypothetical protein